MMNRRKAVSDIRVDFVVKDSLIEGTGLFAKAAFRRRQKLGNLTGELISQAEGRRRAPVPLPHRACLLDRRAD